jgi:hypothetical protein
VEWLNALRGPVKDAIPENPGSSNSVEVRSKKRPRSVVEAGICDNVY